MRGELQNQRKQYNLDKVWINAPDGRFGKLFLNKDANKFDKNPYNCHSKMYI